MLADSMQLVSKLWSHFSKIYFVRQKNADVHTNAGLSLQAMILFAKGFELVQCGRHKANRLVKKTGLLFNPIGFFLTISYGGGHHYFVVIAPMIMKFGTGVKLDVFHTMVTKTFVMSLLLRHYDVITCILADA